MKQYFKSLLQLDQGSGVIQVDQEKRDKIDADTAVRQAEMIIHFNYLYPECWTSKISNIFFVYFSQTPL